MKKQKDKRPARVDAPAKATEGAGLVTSNIGTGSIILAGPKGDVTLVWKGDADAARALPRGEYLLRTTRVERKRERDHYFLSSTGMPGHGHGARFDVEADKATKIRVGDVVHFKPRVKRHGKKLQLGFAIFGAQHRGLSVYKNDKRVPVTYKVFSVKGKEIASGKMNYG